MRIILNVAFAIGVLASSAILVNAAYAQRGPRGGVTVDGQTPRPGGIRQPPVLVQSVPYSCSGELKQCECSNAADCGRMGQAGVCQSGSYQDNQTKSGGWCKMKPV